MLTSSLLLLLLSWLGFSLRGMLADCGLWLSLMMSVSHQTCLPVAAPAAALAFCSTRNSAAESAMWGS
jgi:hypothetical protein